MIISEIFNQTHRIKKIKKILDAYNLQLLEDSNFARKESMKPYHACIGEWIPQQSKPLNILELGCGPGRYVAMLKHFQCNIVGVDPYSFDSWDQFQEHNNIKLMPNVPAESLPFENDTFDFICCTGALLYFDDPEKAMREANRVLKPNGRMVLRTVNKGNLYTKYTKKKLDPASKNLYYKEELEKLLIDCHFTINKYFSYGFWPPVFTNFYWYIYNLTMTKTIQKKLSDFLSPEKRINHIFFVTKNA
jgi:SAM-dependent methyltransferase